MPQDGEIQSTIVVVLGPASVLALLGLLIWWIKKKS